MGGLFPPIFGPHGQGSSQVRSLGLRHCRAVLCGMEMAQEKGTGLGRALTVIAPGQQTKAEPSQAHLNCHSLNMDSHWAHRGTQEGPELTHNLR